MRDRNHLPDQLRPALCAVLALTIGLSSALYAGEPAEELFPAELTQFEAYSKNPVFTAAPAGAWDSQIRERGWIHKEGDLWHMWYTGFERGGSGLKMLGYATSGDGLAWTRSPNNPLDRERYIEDMMVVERGDTYYMFAEGQHDLAQLLTSKDRQHWLRSGQLDVRYTTAKPLSAGPYGTPTAWLEDGVWYLFYERGDAGIWLAKSHDMQTWTNVQDEPVLSPGPGDYDKIYVAFNQIVRHKGQYYAFYHGSGDTQKPRRWTTNVAVSTDRIHWTKFPANPLLPVDANKSSGILVPDGKAFRLYTMHDQVHVHFPKAGR